MEEVSRYLDRIVEINRRILRELEEINEVLAKARERELGKRR
ncbi:hypothetical protein [Pyrobaculum islandicum]|nr:hypothetical protein [Pyrobaculum islandicum]